jgi:fructosamine-3-kinase
MLGGEFESSKVIHSTMPDFIPTPISFGRFKSPGPETYFYMSEYVDMDVATAPDPAEFARRLAQLHKASQSPEGKFGFHVPTCDGDRPHVVKWRDSWAVFYRELFLGVCELDIKRNGPWPEYERAVQQVARKVIPRLLDNLRQNGRPIQPCIIHGDLWEGNVGIRNQTGQSILYDAESFYGHNEVELGAWRCEYTSVLRAEEYTAAYLQHYPPAEPSHEFDDRNRLYSLKGAINYAAGHPGSELRRTSVISLPSWESARGNEVSLTETERAYNNMCYLCEKYAPLEGIDKYDPSIDPSLTGARIVPHQDTAEDLI